MKTEIIIASAIFALLACTSCKKEKKEATEGVLPVDVAYVVSDSVLLSKEYPGSMSATTSVDVVGRVNGTLLTQNYNGGDKVKKGQLLFTIEDTKYRDARDQAQAALTTAKSQYEYASKHYEALKKAMQSDAVSQIEMLQGKSDMETAEASIKNAQAALETALTNLGYCTIYAPINGLISKGVYSPGTYISGDGAPVTLCKIYDNSQLFAEFYIEDVAYIKTFLQSDAKSDHPTIDYNHVPISFSEDLSRPYTGKLVYIAPDVDVSTGTILLRLLVDNPEGEIRDGMYTNVKLPYKLDTKAILVNDAAISTSQSKKFLYVVNDSDKVVYTPIEVGEMANDTMRIVTSGLKGNERYVSKALLKVRPGMTVKPIVEK